MTAIPIDETYPSGPMRPRRGIQRGSVLDMQLYPGDPLTPGVGATKDAKRLKISEAPTILKIPVLPISYADAQVLLESLGGRVAPPAWRGTLPITYHVGPSEAVAHLAVKSDWSLKPIYDVIATMKGSTYPDQWVVRGNHHDGWVFGASDPLSGQVALLAEAKAIGGLAKQGWRPKRTLVYASWDGEEPMLMGSTEWAETHAGELKKKAVIYINSDANARGFLGAGGSQDFQHLVNEVAADVIDPETGVSIGQRLRAKMRVDALAPDANRARQGRGEGRGGYWTRIFQSSHWGRALTFQAFSITWVCPRWTWDLAAKVKSAASIILATTLSSITRRFADPGFIYDMLLAKTVGRLVLRVGEADVPVQRASSFAEAVSDYLDQVKKLADDKTGGS